MTNPLILVQEEFLGTKSHQRKDNSNELGEKIIKQTLNIQQVRVRDIDGIARIEVESDKLFLFNDVQKTNEIFQNLS